MPPFGAYFKSTLEGRLSRVAFLGARRGKYILYLYDGISVGIPIPARDAMRHAAMRRVIKVDPWRVDSPDGGCGSIQLILIQECIYPHVICMHCMLLFCLGGWHYGLASTEAGATPAKLVVISPHLEMYFWTTRCGCASRPSEDEVLLRLASADPERPEERRFAGRGRQTPRWVEDPPTQE